MHVGDDTFWNSGTLLSGCSGQILATWCPFKPAIPASLERPGFIVSSVQYNHKGRALACGGSDGTIVVYAKGRALDGPKPTFNSAVTSLRFSPDSKLLICACRDSNDIRSWDIVSVSLVCQISWHTCMLASA